MFPNAKGSELFSVLATIDPASQAVATRMLRRHGHDVVAVENGKAVLEALETDPAGFDLLLLDMIMPGGIDGLDTYSRICESHPRQKAVIASGYSDSYSVQKAQEIGAGTYVKKPYTVASLARAVYQELAAKSLQTEPAIP